jgi:hypothetical protein
VSGEAATTTGLDLLLQGLDAPVPACVLDRLVEILSCLADGNGPIPLSPSFWLLFYFVLYINYYLIFDISFVFVA